MKAKGSFFVGRRTFIVERFGEERWKQFVIKLGAEHKAFAQPILVTSLVPVEDYALFQEAVAREFFDGDEQSFWLMGEAAAKWALVDGPYAALGRDKDYKGILAKLPLVWTMYFTDGRLDVADHGTHASFHIVGNRLPHISVEYAVMGFARKALEMVGKKPKTQKRLRGVKDGDGSDVQYEFWF
ncbi:MAG TPA: hypothetical protein VGF99_06245 [Myxococcota bacterium]